MQITGSSDPPCCRDGIRNCSRLTPSRYNHQIALSDDRLLIANLLHRTFVCLSDSEVASWHINYRHLHQTRIAELITSGALVTRGTNEIAFIEQTYQQSQHVTSRLQVTIALTLACNMRCRYCYEEHAKKSISPDVEAQILRMVERNLTGKDYLFITWYGGEPLICLDAMERMTNSLLAMCAREGAHYKAVLVTNGLLLDRDRVRRLSALGYWSKIQVTLDGPRDCHNVRRPGVGGRPTYSRIVHNLAEACDHLPIKLRVNLDTENIGRVGDLIDDLGRRGLGGKTSIYFSPIHDAGLGCRDLEGRSNGSLLTNMRLAAVEPQILQYARDHGFGADKSVSSPMTCNCQAVSTESVLIGPEGELYRCWLDVGKSELQVGTLDEPFPFSSTKLLSYVGFNPTKTASCRECKVLPLCLGNCPRFHFDGFPEFQRCPCFKFNLDEYLLQQYETTLGKGN